MAQQQGAQAPAGQPHDDARTAGQMAAEHPVDHRPPQRPESRRAPRVIAAFGSGGGAAWVFSDLASI